MNAERRKHTRVPLQLSVTINVADQEVPVQTWDISLRGMGCTADPRFKPASPCRLRCALDCGTVFFIDGTILRCSDTEAAVFFNIMDEEAFYHLKRLVQYNSTDPDLIDRELVE